MLLIFPNLIFKENKAVSENIKLGITCRTFSLTCCPSPRDIKDTTVGTLSQRVTNQLMGLKGLFSQLRDIESYLEKVSLGTLPINHQIIYHLQDIFNLLPDINLREFVRSMYIKTNDQMLVVYIAALIRSIIALHNLINNKIQNRDAEKNEGKEKKIPSAADAKEKGKEAGEKGDATPDKKDAAAKKK